MKSWGLDNIFFLLELKLAVWFFSGLAVTPTKSKEDSQRPLPPGAEVSWGWKLGRGFPPKGGDMNTIRIQVNWGWEKWFAGLPSRHLTTTASTHQPQNDVVIMLMHLKYERKKWRPKVAEWEMITVHAFIVILNLKRSIFQKNRNGAMRAKSTACK